MTAHADPVAPPIPGSRMRRDAPALAWTGAVLALACLPLAVAAAAMPGQVDGEAAFLKPLKFAASLSLFALTLAWSARLLPAPLRRARRLARADAVVCACILAEAAWITAAAAFGLRSHYNDAQPFLVALYPVMGVVATVMTGGALVRGWAVLRHGTGPLAGAVGWSFVATFALTVPIAFALSMMPVEGAGLWLLGWTLAPGDLRPAHFLAVHAMQAVPLAAVALASRAPLPRGAGAGLTAAWAALTLLAAAHGAGLV